MQHAAPTGNPRKRTAPAADWTICFDDAGSLRTVAEAAAAVMQRVSFKVSRLEDTPDYVLSVDGMDYGNTCIVHVRLRIDARNITVADENAREEFTFCVDCKHLINALDGPACAMLRLEGRDTKLHVSMREPDLECYEKDAELSTYVESGDPIDVLPMSFEMNVEIDVVKLREIIRNAGKAHAEHLRLLVYLTDTAAAQPRSLVVFSIDGDTKHTQKFAHPTSRDDDGSVRVRAASDGSESVFDTDDLEPDFDGTFAIDKISAFVKPFAGRMIVAAVKQDTPLMLSQKLGGVNDPVSQVRFLIAGVKNPEGHA